MTYTSRETPFFNPHPSEIENLKRLDFCRGMRRVGFTWLAFAAIGGLVMSYPWGTSLGPVAEQLWQALFLAMGGFGIGFSLWASAFLVTVRAEMDGGSSWERRTAAGFRRIHRAISVPALAGVLIALAAALLFLGGLLFIAGALLLGIAMATTVIAFSDPSLDHK